MKINVTEEAGKVKEFFFPKVIAEVNDQFVKIARILGDKVPFHSHEHEDELFYILDGELLMEIEGQPAFVMKRGDMTVVRKGTVHRVSSTVECTIMLIETKSTRHTGDVKSEITRSIEEQRR